MIEVNVNKMSRWKISRRYFDSKKILKISFNYGKLEYPFLGAINAKPQDVLIKHGSEFMLVKKFNVSDIRYTDQNNSATIKGSYREIKEANSKGSFSKNML